MISYLIELTVCWMALYILYALLLNKETFFKSNRGYLLLSVIIGLLIPLINLPAVSKDLAQSSVVYLQAVVIGGVQAIESGAQEAQISSQIGLLDVLFWVYIAGLVFFACRFFYGLLQIKELYDQSAKTKFLNTKLVLTPRTHTPFAFFDRLFIPKSFDLEFSDNQKIIEHERAHLSQKHTLDVLFLEILSVFFWCLPPIYLFKKSLKEIHEYLADAEVLKNTKKKQYGLLLLRQVHQGRMRLSLVNHFNQSQLKKRIMMMTKKRSGRRAIWKYLAAAPLCLLLVFAFANHSETAELPLFSKIFQDFDPAQVKAKLTKIATKYRTTEGFEAKQAIFTQLSAQFDKLLEENVTYQEQIKSIITDVANENEIALAIVNDENGAKLPQVVDLLDPVYKDVDEMPRFPGCEDKTGTEQKECAQHELLTFIFNNIKYPKEAQKAGTEGTVVTSFIIDEDGHIRDAKIVREIGDGCGNAVLDMVEKMPKWIPGVKAGKNVAVEFNLPVKFKLANEPSENNPSEMVTDNKLKLERFVVSPNPSDGNFKLEFAGKQKDLSVLITDLKGTTLWSRDLVGFSGQFSENITVESASKTIVVTVTDQATEKVYWEKIILK